MRLEDLQGRSLGRYQIKALLGRGGMAAVYRAHDSVLRRDVALKVLYPQYTGDGASLARFKREAVLAAGLDHPNIVPIYDVGEADGLVYIAMKLLCGRSLADVLRARRQLPIAELVPIVEQIAAALDYAHTRGIVHRDIKPGNILLEESGEPGASAPRATLTDFGIAKSLENSGLTGTGMLIGTPDYMAPEQIRAGQAVDRRADIYALGGVIYRCLTGRRPFEGSTEEVLLGHLQGQPADPSAIEPSLPPAVDAVIRTAMARQPDQRFGSAGELARALRIAARGAATLPHPPQRVITNGAAPRLAPDELVRRAARSNEVTRKGAVVPPGERPVPLVAVPPPIQRARPRGAGAGALFLALVLLLLIGGGGLLLAQNLRQSNGGSGAIIGAGAPTPPEQPTLPPAPTLAPGPTAASLPTAIPLPPTEIPATVVSSGPTAAPTLVPTSPPAPSPTGTPTPTSTSAPTSTSTPCPEQPIRGFGKLWNENEQVRQRLGCPLQPETDRELVEQNFEHGWMIWVKSPDEAPSTIFAIFRDETRQTYVWQDFKDTWREGDPLSGGATPPEGRYEPVRGFGKVWRDNPQVRAALGWGTTPEEAVTGAYQAFEQGFMLFSNRGLLEGKSIYVFYTDNTFERYDDQYVAQGPE